MTIPVVEPEEAIMYRCPFCEEHNYYINTLEFYSAFQFKDVLYQDVETDALDCQRCGREIRVIRHIT
ncbi:MAG: hypothetical protein HOG49_41450 [Candidatus Scalindua sp.]|jgi:hypothetical protein|nr:hypothetical protein [Candidatus Scalindua sp.]